MIRGLKALTLGFVEEWVRENRSKLLVHLIDGNAVIWNLLIYIVLVYGKSCVRIFSIAIFYHISWWIMYLCLSNSKVTILQHSV